MESHSAVTRPGSPVMAVQGITKAFGGLKAVDGVSAEVREGEILGLIGPNGAGKTTLFNLIAGSLAPDAGTILLDGVAVHREPTDRRTRRGLARTFQIPRPFPEMTVLENVLTAGQHQAGETVLANFLRSAHVARQEREAAEKARLLLDFLSLSRVADEPARILSGGQRKLLELARALMVDPRILLLDEPAAGVNPALLDFIIDRIAEINRRGITVLLIEHNMGMVQRLCPRALVMAAGRTLAEGAPADLMRDREVIEAYLGGAAA